MSVMGSSVAQTASSGAGPDTLLTGWRGHWVNAVVLIAAVLTPIISYAGQLGLAPLAAILGLLCLPLLGFRRAPLIGVGILLILVIWELVSMTWSIAAPVHPDLHRYKSVEALTGVKLVFELAFYGALVVAVRGLPSTAARRAMIILAVGLALLALVMSLDGLTNGAVYRGLRTLFHQKDQPELFRRNAARGCYTVALLFWPAMLRFSQTHQRLWQVVLTLGFLIAAIGLGVDAPIVAVVLGGAVSFAVRRLGRAAIWGLLASTVAYFALTPLLVSLIFPAHVAVQTGGGVVKASWFARAGIWRFVSGEIPVHPVIGWGMDASRMWKDIIPLHPHNAALQVWLELGAVGAAIVIVFWAWIWERIARLVDHERGSGAAAAAVAVAYLTIGALSFGVWQEWWLGLGALSVVFCTTLAVAREGVVDDPSGGLTELTLIGEAT